MQYGSKNAGVTVMFSTKMRQHPGRCFGGIRVERYHRASRIAFDDCQLQPVANLQRSADQRLLLESVLLIVPLDIKVGPETALVDVHAEFFT